MWPAPNKLQLFKLIWWKSCNKKIKVWIQKFALHTQHETTHIILPTISFLLKKELKWSPTFILEGQNSGSWLSSFIHEVKAPGRLNKFISENWSMKTNLFEYVRMKHMILELVNYAIV